MMDGGFVFEQGTTGDGEKVACSRTYDRGIIQLYCGSF